MLIPHVGLPKLFLEKIFKDHKIELVEKMNHWHSFIDDLRGEAPLPSANFDYSGPLTETILLVSITTRFPKHEIVWDASNLSFKDNIQSTALVKKKYREDEM